MRVKQVAIRKLKLKMMEPWVTSTGREEDKVLLLIYVWTDSGMLGYGECVAMQTPFYVEETVETADNILRQFLIPRVWDRELAHPDQVRAWLQPVRGNRMAKAALETAIWDAWAKTKQISLATALGGQKREIPVGISIGMQPDIRTLLMKVEQGLLAGYGRIKLKIAPGWDIEPIAAVRKAFGPIALMVDANSAYTLQDIEHLKRIDAFNLLMIEQPLAYDDLLDHATLQKQLETPVCLDESIRSLKDAQWAIKIGACRTINIKIGRVGGLTEARDIQALCQQSGVDAWCGGMLEAGVGRLANVAVTSLPGFTLPGDTAPSDHYFAQDIVDPPITFVRPGFLAVPDGFGLGANINERIAEQSTMTYDLFRNGAWV